MFTKKHLLAVTAAALALPFAISLAGCSTSVAPAGKASADAASFAGTQLTAWNGIPYEPFTSTNNRQLEDCAKSVGVTVKNETFPGEQLLPKVLQAATSKSLPDILLLDSASIENVNEAGILTDLADYGISGEGLDPKAKSLGEAGGKLYGLTPSVNTLALYYNKKMFAEAGIKPPSTFDELRAAAKALTTPEHKGIALPGSNQGAGSFVFLPFVLNAGGDPKSITDDGTVQALQLWKDLITDGSMSKEMVNWGWDAPDQIVEGKAAMAVSGPWTLGNATAKGMNDLAVVPMPTMTAGAKPVSPLGGETFTVPVTNAKNQAAAAAVIKCVTSGKNQLEQATKGQRIPGDTAAAVEYAKVAPELGAYVTQIPTSYNRSTELGSKWEAIGTKYSSAIQYAMVGGLSPAEALKKAASE